MQMNVMQRYRLWCESAADSDVKSELLEMEGSDEKIEDAFYRDLSFGTGGLRGVIGAGTNRMNVYTVAKASQGLADYINRTAGSSPCIARELRLPHQVGRVRARRGRRVRGERHPRQNLFRADADAVPVVRGATARLRRGDHGDGVAQPVQVQRLQGVRRGRLPDHH